MFPETISEPKSRKHKLFVTMQETDRKDNDRALGFLQAIWNITRNPAWFVSIEDMKLVMKCVIIFQNMVVEECCFASCKRWRRDYRWGVCVAQRPGHVGWIRDAEWTKLPEKSGNAGALFQQKIKI